MFSLGFDRKLGPLSYALSAIPVFLSQHVLVLLVFMWFGRRVPHDVWFVVVPLRTLATLDRAPPWVLVFASALLARTA